MIVRNSVVFPAPLGPISPWTVPGSNVRSIGPSANQPYFLRRLVISSIAVLLTVLQPAEYLFHLLVIEESLAASLAHQCLQGVGETLPGDTDPVVRFQRSHEDTLALSSVDE